MCSAIFTASASEAVWQTIWIAAAAQALLGCSGVDSDNSNLCGLEPGLVNFLSDTGRLCSAFHKLRQASAILKNSGQAYTVTDAVLARIQESMTSELYAFWRLQALIVAYKSISVEIS